MSAGSEPVSVVIPTFNRAALIGRALKTVLAAAAPGDEVIVVDDGSSDETPAVLASYGERIRAVRTTNGGAGRARNLGIAAARRPLVAFLDSDDEWTSDRLLLGRRLLAARPDVLFCFSNFGLRSSGTPDRHDGLAVWHDRHAVWERVLGPGVPYSTLAALPRERDDFPVHVGDLYPAQLQKGHVAVQTLLVRRQAAGAALRFAEDLPTLEDWECTARLARAGLAAYMDCETAWQWGHGCGRLTDADLLVRIGARIVMIERLWAADTGFLAQHGEAVARVLDELRLIRAKGLLCRGRNREARQDLGRCRRVPFYCWWLAALPGPLTGRLLRLRARVQHTP